MWLMCCMTLANAKSGPAYFFAEKSTALTGSTCEELTPPKLSIASKEDCEAAAAAVDIVWYPTPDHFDDRPYGCHIWDSSGIFQGVGFNSNTHGRDEQDGLRLVCRNYPEEVAASPAATWGGQWSTGTVVVSGFGACFLCQVTVAMVAGFRSGRLDRSLRASARSLRKRSSGAADGSKDPKKSMPDLEAAEKRDGETAGLQEKVSKEEQNSDDPPTPATAETEANQDVFIAPTLDFLTSKALSYSLNPVLLTSPIAKEGQGKENLEFSFGVQLQLSSVRTLTSMSKVHHISDHASTSTIYGIHAAVTRTRLSTKI
jgi:hypothetical protein